eukprot:jgi/Picre1/34019/NNA_001496.t1
MRLCGSLRKRARLRTALSHHEDKEMLSLHPSSLHQQPVKSKGYIPPHLRNKGVTSAPKASFSLARDQSDSGGKIRPGSMTSRSQPAGGNLPPGAEPAGASSKAALKNAKRRAKKKQTANQST